MAVRLIIQFVISIVISVLVATGIMILLYSLPADRVKANIWRSNSIYTSESAYPMWAGEGYKLSQLDNITDGYMLLEAIYPGTEDPVRYAMLNPYISYDGINPQQAVLMQSHGTDTESYEATYARYWHGYLLFVKPLLMILDLGDLRVLNMILVMALFLILINKTAKELGRKAALAMFATWLVLSPVSVIMSFQFSTTFYVMVIASMLVLYHHDWFNKGTTRYPMLFLFIGIVTNFIDFLTYPMLGMAIPLTLAILMRERREEKGTFAFGVVNSISWGIGYGCMWIGKWVIGSWLTGADIIGNARYEAQMQSTGQDVIYGTRVTAINSILKNVRVIVKWPFMIMFAVALLLGIWYLLRRNRRLHLELNLTDLALLFVALFPAMWYSVFQAHSISCYWFTYRNLCITVFAGMLFLGRRIAARTN